MNLLCLILFLSAVALWFFSSEHDILLGIFKPTCAVRGGSFRFLVFIAALLGLWISIGGDVEASVFQHFGIVSIDFRMVMVILMSSFITLVALRNFNVRGSVVYAVLGAMGAGFLKYEGSVNLRFVLSFVAAPVVAFLLSAGIRTAFKMIFSRIQVHMIMLSYFMRHVVIICIILATAAMGLNFGGMLCGIGGMIHEGSVVAVFVLSVASVVMLLRMNPGQEISDRAESLFSDFSIYAVVSVGLSVTFALLFFSFESSAGLLYLTPVPLSVPSLVAASVAGSEVAQRSRLVNDGVYMKEIIALVVSPSVSFALSYLILSIIGDGPEDALAGFVVMSVAILLLVALAFAGYTKILRRQKEATDRIMYAQRQQIYEHSRALSDMELKVVISENQALHNAVEMKKQEVVNVALSIVEQREFLESLSEMIKTLIKTADQKEKEQIISDLDSAVRQRLSYERDVDSQYFYAQAESVHEDFNAKLSENFPDMTQQERRLATLLRLGFSSKYIATLMGITPKSVEIGRYRLRQKLGLSKGDNLVNFIKSI